MPTRGALCAADFFSHRGDVWEFTLLTSYGLAVAIDAAVNEARGYSEKEKTITLVVRSNSPAGRLATALAFLEHQGKAILDIETRDRIESRLHRKLDL